MQSNKSNILTQLKSFQREINDLKINLNKADEKNIELTKELTLANEVIFQNQSSFDLNTSMKIKEIEEIEDTINSQKRKSKKLEKELNLSSCLLAEEKRKHEETVRALLDADKRNQELTKQITILENQLGGKGEEISRLTDKVIELSKKFKEMANEQQRKLEYYQELLSNLSSNEDEHLKSLQQIQEYEKTMAENIQKLEDNKIVIGGLHKAIDNFKGDIEKYEKKVIKLEETVTKLTVDFTNHLDNKNEKIKQLHKLIKTIKERYSIENESNLLLSEDKSPVFAESEKSPDKIIESFDENQSESGDKSFRNSIRICNDKLNTLFNELVKLIMSESPPGIDKVTAILNKMKIECEENTMIVNNSLNFEELYESLIKEFEEYKEVTQDLEQRLDCLNNENAELYTALEDLKQINDTLEKKLLMVEGENKEDKKNEWEEIVTFDSVSYDKQVSIIEHADNEYLEKIKFLEGENSRLRHDLELMKSNFSSLRYSTSEDDHTHKRNMSEELSATWIDKTEKDSQDIKGIMKKLIIKPRDDILILDHDDNENDESDSMQGVSSPDVEMIADEYSFKS